MFCAHEVLKLLLLLFKQAPVSYVHNSNHVISGFENLEMSESRLLFSLEPQRLWQGSLTVQCIGLISQVLATSSLELIVGEGTTGSEFQRSKYKH